MVTGIGKEIRMGRIIDPNNNRAMVVAADHGFMLGPIRGVINLEETLLKVIRGGPDAILLSPGQAEKLSHLFRGRGAPALLVRADWTNAFRDKTYTLPARKIKRVAVADAKEALSLGASGIVTYYFIGHSEDETEAYNYELMSIFSRECDKLGLPYIVEALPFGERVTGANYAQLISVGMRIAAEAGADALKTAYTGDVDSFRKAVDSAGIPVLVLGGAKARTIRDALEIVDEALIAGGSGVVFGRQVIQAEDPEKFVESVRMMVHEGKSLKEIISPYQGPVHLQVRAKNCVGCRECQVICSFSHDEEFSLRGSRIRVDVELPDKFIPFPCTLCGKCVNVCPTQALVFNHELKYVEFIKERCIGPKGCKKCVLECPFHVVGWDDKEKNPFICDMCKGSPRCVEYCPTDALLASPYRGD